MRVGDDAARGGAVIHFLVHVALEAVGRRPLWKLAPRMDAQTARQTAARLENLEAGAASAAADCLREEKRIILLSLRDEFATKSVAEVAGESAEARIKDNPAAAKMLGRVWGAMTSKEQVLRSHSAAMDTLALQCEVRISSRWRLTPRRPLPRPHYQHGT